MAEGLDYAGSGVDIDLEGNAVGALIGALSRSVRPAGTPGAPVDLPGGFGGLVEFGDNYLALATDGVGSKLQIASILNQWHGVGIDCMAMNVNDLLCVGAEPIAFVDYIAVPKPDPIIHKALGKSLAEACLRARVTLAGGETASLPGIVTELDLSGTALGWLPKGSEITGVNLTMGDILIGLPSSGVHSNGYSLVRKVMEHCGASYEDTAPFEINENRIERFNEGPITLGEIFLNPTRIYCDPVVDLIQDGPCETSSIHAICHVTGGGLSNLLRLHDSLGWHISNPLPVLEEFKWIAEMGNVSVKEMHRTYNMGCGMIIAVDSTVADSVCSWLNERLPGCAIIGEVVDSGHKVTHSIPDVVFEHY
ncbi:MAG: phosphoribosylformylglycinamidine cyclo-ligase [Candidatus Poseidoniaceae archaeon]|jgi:phosphoribosylformylglycinamidine cyclo-ligase|nr:phosphoribosylformylglycinamidine cyclo-ligase [Candidatus Poseidoniaceae archaeon]